MGAPRADHRQPAGQRQGLSALDPSSGPRAPKRLARGCTPGGWPRGTPVTCAGWARPGPGRADRGRLGRGEGSEPKWRLFLEEEEEAGPRRRRGARGAGRGAGRWGGRARLGAAGGGSGAAPRPARGVRVGGAASARAARGLGRARPGAYLRRPAGRRRGGGRGRAGGRTGRGRGAGGASGAGCAHARSRPSHL